jgi:hypothetical protein
MVVDQHAKAVPQSVPDVPDERPMLEHLTVLLKEAVAQPVLQGFA